MPVEMVSMGARFPEAIPEKVMSMPATVPRSPSRGAVEIRMARKGRRLSTHAISSSSQAAYARWVSLGDPAVSNMDESKIVFRVAARCLHTPKRVE